MDKIKVFVVDDAVVIRKIIADTIAAEEDMEVVGSAPNGVIALQKLPNIRPDVITLDVEMPEMNGIETLREIKKLYPRIPVIMFSTLTERGARTTIDALSLGASDYVTKPANVGSVSQSKEAVRQELLSKIRCLTRRSNSPAKSKAVDIADSCTQANPKSFNVKPTTTPPITCSTSLNAKPNLVVVGVSTGGPNALVELVGSLPVSLPTPVLVVQHMPPIFTRLLAERLNAQGGIKVIEAENGAVAEAGTVYIAPGDYHMELRQGGANPYVIALTQGPPENSCRPAVDVLFRSAASLCGNRTLGVILTGMGHDGLRGCEALRQAGGLVLAQDESSSVVWGMPGAVVNSGLAHWVAPLGEIGGMIATCVTTGQAVQ